MALTKIEREPGENWDAGHFTVFIRPGPSIVIVHKATANAMPNENPKFVTDLKDLQAIIDWVTKTDSELLRNWDK